MGKILVVNTLAASLFVYKLNVLPNLTVKQISKIQKTITNYLWSGRRAKIPMRVLTNDKMQGGCRLVDFQGKQIALKAQWVKRVEHDHVISTFTIIYVQE